MIAALTAVAARASDGRSARAVAVAVATGSSSPVSITYDKGVYAVNGSGTDIWGTSDQFNYA